MTDIREIPKVGCDCSTCQSYCRNKPGWFLPGEAEKAAAVLGMTMPEFFKRHLAIDWLEDAGEDSEDVFVLAPVLRDETPGKEYPGDPRGVCSLYVDGKCLIHEAKPHECAIAHHDMTDRKEAARQHQEIGKAWIHHQDQITELLGREPRASYFEGGGIFGFGL